MEKKLIKNPESHIVKTGETYEFTYKTIGVPFLSKIHTSLVVNRLKTNEKFEVVDVSSSQGEFIVRVKIVKNPFPLAIVAGVVNTALIGTFAWLALSKVEQIINTPEGKTSNLATSLGIAIGVISLGAFALKK